MEEFALKNDAADPLNMASDEHLSSNDFSLNHRNGKEESLQHGNYTSGREVTPELHF
jgi:hypothetical protein